MNRLTDALAVLYGAASLALAHCAVRSWQHDSATYTAGLAACSLLLAAAIAQHRHNRHETRALRVEVERATRPFTTTQDTAVAEILAPCCDAWWSTAGAEHDRTACTRKDHQ